MDFNVSAIAGISRATRPVSSDTQIAVLQRRLEALDKQRASAASSSDETASFRMQALTEQMGLLQTQIGQLQQAVASAAARQSATEPADEENEQPAPDDDVVSARPPSEEPSQPPLRSAEATRTPESPAGQAILVETGQDPASAQRDAAAVARARADGSLVGSNVDTYV